MQIYIKKLLRHAIAFLFLKYFHPKICFKIANIAQSFIIATIYFLFLIVSRTNKLNKAGPV